MSQEVYILLRGDPKKPSLSEDGEKVIGVVSDQKVANQYYAAQVPSDQRDVVMFVLDEVAELTGLLGTHTIPEPEQAAPAATGAPGITKQQMEELKEVRHQQQLQSLELQKRLDLLKKRRQKSR